MIDPVAQEQEEFSVDLTNADKGGGGKSKYVFADGKYPATCTDVAPGTAKSGTAKYVFTFLLTGGPGEGTTKDVHLSLGEKALWKLEKTLRALGVKGEGVVKFKRADVVGKSAILDMKQNPQPSGKIFMDVEAVLSPESAGLTSTTGAPASGAGTQMQLPF